MAFETILSKVTRFAAATAPVLGKSLKFDFGGSVIVIDGKGDANVVSTEDKEVDCAISVSMDDLQGMMNGSVNPMMAFMSGKIKVKGDMGVAMKLQSLFKG
jgi:acyl-CoA dehydrogenase